MEGLHVAQKVSTRQKQVTLIADPPRDAEFSLAASNGAAGPWGARARNRGWSSETDRDLFVIVRGL